MPSSSTRYQFRIDQVPDRLDLLWFFLFLSDLGFIICSLDEYIVFFFIGGVSTLLWMFRFQCISPSIFHILDFRIGMIVLLADGEISRITSFFYCLHVLFQTNRQRKKENLKGLATFFPNFPFIFTISWFLFCSIVVLIKFCFCLVDFC